MSHIDERCSVFIDVLYAGMDSSSVEGVALWWKKVVLQGLQLSKLMAFSPSSHSSLWFKQGKKVPGE